MALIVLDANLLLFSYNPDAVLHVPAKAWLEQVLSSEDMVGIPMLAISAFLRIATDARLPEMRLAMDDAFEVVEELLQLPNVRVLHTDGAHLGVLQKVLQDSGARGKMVTDAQFAAIAIQNGATFYSADRHFARFPGLRWVNPLESK